MFVKADEIPKNAKPKKDNIVVTGEATGHAHRLVNGTILQTVEEIPATFEKETKMWIKASKGAKVIHEEHAPIELEIGFYVVVRQREYDEEKERLVMD